MSENRTPGVDPEDETTDEAFDYDAMTTELGLALPSVTPDPAVRARLLETIARTPQRTVGQTAASEGRSVPPATTATGRIPGSTTGRTAAPERGAGRRVVPLDADATRGHSDETAGDAQVIELKRWRRAATWLGAAAAVLLVAGVALGGWASNANQQRVAAEQRLNQQDSRRDATLQVFTAPDAVIRAGQSGNGGSVSIASSRSLNRSAVISRDLPALTADQTYELWYISGQQARSAGTFAVSGDVTYTSLDGQLDGATHIGVTVEPAGGSKAPTTTPIVLQPTTA